MADFTLCINLQQTPSLNEQRVQRELKPAASELHFLLMTLFPVSGCKYVNMLMILYCSFTHSAFSNHKSALIADKLQVFPSSLFFLFLTVLFGSLAIKIV